MKSFVAFLFVYLLFGNGKGLPTDNTLRDPPPPAYNVTVNATWAFTSGVAITNVVLDVYNLQASQYAAFGLSQNQSMVNLFFFKSLLMKRRKKIEIYYLYSHKLLISRVKVMFLFVNVLLMIQLP